MTKTSRQKLKYIEKEKSFLKYEAFFIIFKGLSFAKNCLRPKSAPLKTSNSFAFIIMLLEMPNMYMALDTAVNVNANVNVNV